VKKASRRPSLFLDQFDATTRNPERGKSEAQMQGLGLAEERRDDQRNRSHRLSDRDGAIGQWVFCFFYCSG
jgi:hypothetical protein